MKLFGNKIKLHQIYSLIIFHYILIRLVRKYCGMDIEYSHSKFY